MLLLFVLLCLFICFFSFYQVRTVFRGKERVNYCQQWLRRRFLFAPVVIAQGAWLLRKEVLACYYSYFACMGIRFDRVQPILLSCFDSDSAAEQTGIGGRYLSSWTVTGGPGVSAASSSLLPYSVPESVKGHGRMLSCGIFLVHLHAARLSPSNTINIHHTQTELNNPSLLTSDLHTRNAHDH